ncbi:MAG TPA: tetratricopeptide repeat protein [Acidobacteriota bacterium]|nr:tetratricopeptide repeat protein [Acidobacteriota bacterium]
MTLVRNLFSSLLLVALCGTAVLAQGDFQKGLSYYKQGKYRQAISEFEPIVEENPEYEDGHRILGHCYLQTRQLQKSIEHFKKAMSLKDGNLGTYLGLANAYYNAGRYSDAAATLLRGERFASDNRERLPIYRLRGAAYFNQGSYAEAIDDLEKAQQINRGNPKVILQLGLAHYQLKNFDKAEQYLRQAKALDPSEPQAPKFLNRVTYDRALQALAAKQSGRAISLLEEFVGSNPQDGEAWYNLGEAYLLEKRHADAESAFLNAAQHLPGKWEIQERLGYIYEVTGKYQKSLAAYQKAYQASQRAALKQAVDRVKERISRESS